MAVEDRDFMSTLYRNVIAFMIDAGAGTIGSIFGVWVGNPFDVVKTRMQAGSIQYKSSLECARAIIKTEGPMCLYRGSVIASLGQAPTNFMSFGHYGWAKSILRQYFPSRPNETPLWQIYVSGCWAGAVQSIGLAPFEHIKVQQQLMGATGQHGLWDTTRHIYQERGLWRGLMRGWVATTIRDVPSFGLYFSAFEWTKQQYVDSQLRSLRAQGLEADRSSIAIPEWVHLLGGGLAGVISWTISIPSDVVKSNIQGSPITTATQDLRFMTVAKRLYRDHGKSAFVRGMAPCLLRSIPVNAVAFAVYEWCLHHFGQWARLESWAHH